MHTVRWLALVLVVAGLATACASTSSSVVATPTRSVTPAATAKPAATGTPPAGDGSSAPVRTTGLTACRTGALRITVDPRQAGGAAGSTYYPLDFTNTAAAACLLGGYPRVSFVTAANTEGNQIGAAAMRNPQFGPMRIKLNPGAQAHAWLQVATSADYPAATCRPATAHGLRVYPPGQKRASYVRQNFPACSSGQARLLTVMPVRGGKATQGSTP